MLHFLSSLLRSSTRAPALPLSCSCPGTGNPPAYPSPELAVPALLGQAGQPPPGTGFELHQVHFPAPRFLWILYLVVAAVSGMHVRVCSRALTHQGWNEDSLDAIQDSSQCHVRTLAPHPHCHPRAAHPLGQTRPVPTAPRLRGTMDRGAEGPLCSIQSRSAQPIPQWCRPSPSQAAECF